MVFSAPEEDTIKGIVLDVEGIPGDHSVVVEPACPVTRVARPLLVIPLVT